MKGTCICIHNYGCEFRGRFDTSFHRYCYRIIVVIARPHSVPQEQSRAGSDLKNLVRICLSSSVFTIFQYPDPWPPGRHWRVVYTVDAELSWLSRSSSPNTAQPARDKQRRGHARVPPPPPPPPADGPAALAPAGLLRLGGPHRGQLLPHPRRPGPRRQLPQVHPRPPGPLIRPGPARSCPTLDDGAYTRHLSATPRGGWRVSVRACVCWGVLSCVRARNCAGVGGWRRRPRRRRSRPPPSPPLPRQRGHC